MRQSSNCIANVSLAEASRQEYSAAANGYLLYLSTLNAHVRGSVLYDESEGEVLYCHSCNMIHLTPRGGGT